MGAFHMLRMVASIRQTLRSKGLSPPLPLPLPLPLPPAVIDGINGAVSVLEPYIKPCVAAGATTEGAAGGATEGAAEG